MFFIIVNAYPAFSSLPPAVGDSNYQPNEFVPAFTIPLTNHSSISIDPSQDVSTQPLPLIVFAIQPNDPWSIAVTTSTSSIDDFLLGAMDTLSHYLFLDYETDGKTVIDHI